jgi:type IV secretion system protein VirB9
MKTAMMAVAAAFGILSVAAPDAAASKARDPRIHVEQYDPDQVYRIYTAPNNPTLIQFERGEYLVKTDEGMLGMGDSKAWSVGPKGSNIMLKPKAKDPDTKLLVVTNRRTYAFEIVSITAKSRIEPTLILRFEYPDTKAAIAEAEASKQGAIAERLQQIGKDGRTVAYFNRSYVKRGDEALAPSLVEDDGRFTYMRFDSTRELPVVFKLLPDGQEALTNFHMDSNTGTMVIHETAAQFILRYGKAVMAIRNDGWNPNGRLDTAGTTLPRTLRMEKDAK